VKILIRNRHGTIYPERGGYTGVIDLGYCHAARWVGTNGR
jgi:hypothetical protein